jgi:hypothetical protein
MSENILANGSTVPAMPTGRRQAGMIKALSFLACLSAGLSIYRQKEESGIQETFTFSLIHGSPGLTPEDDSVCFFYVSSRLERSGMERSGDK